MIETIYSNSSFQFKHINTKDVQDLFENLNPRKSCSDTGLMPKLMKKVAEGIAPSVKNLYKRCTENSNWPAIWKRGELTPIFKKGDKHNVENYRPITTLSIIDKVFWITAEQTNNPLFWPYSISKIDSIQKESQLWNDTSKTYRGLETCYRQKRMGDYSIYRHE